MKNYILFSFVFILASCQLNEAKTKTSNKENYSQDYSENITSNDFEDKK